MSAQHNSCKIKVIFNWLFSKIQCQRKYESVMHLNNRIVESYRLISLKNKPNWKYDIIKNNIIKMHKELTPFLLIFLSIIFWKRLKWITDPVGTGRKLDVNKTFWRRPRRLLDVFYTFNLRPVSTGEPAIWWIKKLVSSNESDFIKMDRSN